MYMSMCLYTSAFCICVYNGTPMFFRSVYIKGAIQRLQNAFSKYSRRWFEPLVCVKRTKNSESSDFKLNCDINHRIYTLNLRLQKSVCAKKFLTCGHHHLLYRSAYAAKSCPGLYVHTLKSSRIHVDVLLVFIMISLIKSEFHNTVVFLQTAQ